jgi:hypothetical protein
MRKPVLKLQKYWLEYQFHVLLVVVLLDVFTFSWVSQIPQCCDVNLYLSEASNIKYLGFLPQSGTPWLSAYHNYMYPSFLFLARSIGLTSRTSISMLQFALIFGACILISVRLHKVLALSVIQLMSITLLAAFFPILAFSGYTLTESLASALLIIWFGLWLELVLKKYSSFEHYLLLLITSLVSGIIWMTRPSLVWIPLTHIICVVVIELKVPTSIGSRLKHSVGSALMTLGVLVLVAMPQYLITRGTRTIVNGVFHLDDWATNRTLYPSLLRYVTNMSGCGPLRLFFSPDGQTAEALSSGHYNSSPIYRLIGFIARWCSGWDAVPSPLTYVDHLSNFPWIFLSALSGFLIAAPFFLALCRRNPGLLEGRMRFAELGLLFIFIVSQIAMGITDGEFRYNFAGWIFAGLSLVLLPQHFKDGFPWRRYVAVSLSISFFVIVVGQLTLSFSQAWLACVK